MSTQATQYFARATAGTEEIVALEIKGLGSTRSVALARRRVDLCSAVRPAQLLALRSPDDVFVFAGELHGLDHTRPSLERIPSQISGLAWDQIVGVCRQARPVPERPTYAVTASLQGGRNYSRFDVAEAVHSGLSNRRDWVYVENTADSDLPDLDIRILLEDDTVLVGLRLGKQPLHRRPYKLHSLPGSLKAPVAYCLSFLALIADGDVVADPMCGVGTIPIEAALGFAPAAVWGLDISAEAIAYATQNAEAAGAPLHLQVGDALQLPFAVESVDGVVCNLPWGRQVAGSRSLPSTYRGAVGELARVLREGGKAVLLTDRTDYLLEAVDAQPALHLAAARQISLFGSHPTMCVFVKSTAALDQRHPFLRTGRLESWDVTWLIQRFARETLGHPDARLQEWASRTWAEERPST